MYRECPEPPLTPPEKWPWPAEEQHEYGYDEEFEAVRRMLRGEFDE